MTGRYEIVDLDHPDWRGMRFTSFDRAEREWMRAVQPMCGPDRIVYRFVLVDRLTKTTVLPIA